MDKSSGKKAPGRLEQSGNGKETGRKENGGYGLSEILNRVEIGTAPSSYWQQNPFCCRFQ
jgi:hypothetical protein